MPYIVELTNVYDSCADALFTVEPPVRFIDERAQQIFGETVLSLVARRSSIEDVEPGSVTITHANAEGTKTLGYAKLPGLQYGSGANILKEAITLALNGNLDGYVMPWDEDK